MLHDRSCLDSSFLIDVVITEWIDEFGGEVVTSVEMAFLQHHRHFSDRCRNNLNISEIIMLHFIAEN